MWDLGNRGIIVLVSALTGCILVYNITVQIITLTLILTLLLVASCACYYLFTDDRFQSNPRRALLDFGRFVEEIAVNLNEVLGNTVLLYLPRTLRDLRDIIRRFYDKRLVFNMQKQRITNSYQLSTDTSVIKCPASRFDGLERFSPIPHLENRIYRNSNVDQSPTNPHSGSFSKFTSTPMTAWKKDDSGNGDLIWNSRLLRKKPSMTHSESQSIPQGENSMHSSGDESQWGISSNPKMRSKAAGIKTVQTTAGPLLASTRYNIDTKVYSDVTSPGLTTRLSKYAIEANDKLTHQAQYGPGQFPRVNLNASPVPFLNTKYAKTKTPVMVRIAPPESTRYSPPDKQKILSNACLQENKNQQTVARALREMYLKRHASDEDVTSDLVKKQRTDGMFRDNIIRNSEEAKQKRSRDESSKSEEDWSPQNKSVRPTKRTKTPSCYDILNSLSSSVHVISGVKRKAVHLSRSGTPDFGKHFKSLDNSHGANSHTLSEPSTENIKPAKNDLDEKCPKPMELVSQTIEKVQEPSPKTTVGPSLSKDIVHSKEYTEGSKAQVKSHSTSPKPVQLKDKLFMRAEPQKTDKLKLLAEEHNDVKAKFTTNDVEEIKKIDIVNMRQTSMRARLQSMFDAISGKTKSKINPDVVIQAEEVVPTPTVTSSGRVTLNSCMITTNVNTSPIATSAVTPVESTTKLNAKPTKHVSFNLPAGNSEQASVASVAGQSTPSIQTTSSTQFGSGTPTTVSNVNSTTTPILPFGAPLSNNVTSTANFPKIVSNPNAMVKSSSVLSTVISSPAAASVNIDGAFTAKNDTNRPTISHTNTSNSTDNVSSTPSFVFGHTSTASTSSFIKPSPSLDKNSSGTGVSISTGQAVQSSETPTTATSTAQNSLNQTSTTTSTSSSSVFAFGTKSIPRTASFDTPQSSTSTATFGTPQTTTGISNFGMSQTTTQVPTFGTLQTTKVCGPTLVTNTSNGANIFGNTATTENLTPTTTSATCSKDNATTTAPITSSAFSSFIPPASSAAFTFGANLASSAPNGKPAFSFNAVTKTPSSTSSSAIPVFGTTTNTSGSLSFSTSSTPALQFGMTSTTPVFGSSVATTSFASKPLISTTSASSPSFSTPKSTSATAFNSNISTSVFGAPTTTTSSLFSSSNNATVTNSTTPKSTAFTIANTAIFGQASTSTFGTSSQAFGTTVPSFFGSQTTKASTFGTSNTTTSSFANTQSLPVFGTSSGVASDITPSSAQPTPVFGSTTSTTASSAFGNIGSASTPIFGANTTSTTGNFGASTTPTTGSFGASTSAAGSFGANTTSATGSFGVNTTSATGGFVGSTTSATGSCGASTTLATGSFGASTTPAAGSFGASITPATVNFGSSTTPSTGSFGTNTTPSTASFGTSTTASAGNFGASSTTSSTFGTQSANAPAYDTANASGNTFVTNTSAPFGVTQANASNAPLFGAPTSTPAFGASGANSTFSFGSSQPTTQQNTTFSFGSNAASNNTANTGSVPFQFGAGSSKPATTGFNFSAPSATPTINFGGSNNPPVFNAPTAGMFSIGSGSSAPRSRSVRSRKPR